MTRGAEQVAGGVLGVALVVLGRRHGRRRGRRAAAGPAAHHRACRPRSPTTSGSWSRTCCGSSCRRCCCTRRARSPPPRCTPRRHFAVTAAAPIGNTVVMVGCLARLPGRRRVPTPGSTSRRASGCCWSPPAPAGCVAFVGDPARGLRAVGVPAAAPAAAAATRGWPRCCGTRAGASCCTPAPACCWAPRSSAGAAVEGGVVAYQVGWVFFLAPVRRAGPADPHGDPPRAGRSRPASTGRPRARASVRWALERMALLVVPVAAGMVALAGPAMRARVVRRGDGRRRRRCWPRRWPRWPSGCCPTARSCCWPGASTPSATAGRPAWSSVALRAASASP